MSPASLLGGPVFALATGQAACEGGYNGTICSINMIMISLLLALSSIRAMAATARWMLIVF